MHCQKEEWFFFLNSKWSWLDVNRNGTLILQKKKKLPRLCPCIYSYSVSFRILCLTALCSFSFPLISHLSAINSQLLFLSCCIHLYIPFIRAQPVALKTSLYLLPSSSPHLLVMTVTSPISTDSSLLTLQLWLLTFSPLFLTPNPLLITPECPTLSSIHFSLLLRSYCS